MSEVLNFIKERINYLSDQFDSLADKKKNHLEKIHENECEMKDLAKRIESLKTDKERLEKK